MRFILFLLATLCATSNGAQYTVSSAYGPWDKVNASCASIGSHLVEINSVEEAESLHKQFNDTTSYWIGLIRVNSKWIWSSSGLETNYTMWFDLYPLNDNGYDCALYYYNSWMNHDCKSDMSFRGICETDVAAETSVEYPWENWSTWNGSCIKDGVCQTHLNISRTRSRKCDSQGCVETCKAVMVCAEIKECQTTTIPPATTSAYPEYSSTETISSELGTCQTQRQACEDSLTEVKQQLTVCQQGETTTDTKFFVPNTTMMMWTDAKAYCERNSSQLLEIKTAEKQTLVNDFLQQHHYLNWYWMGLSYDAGRETFVWNTSNAVADYTNWYNITNTMNWVVPPYNYDCCYVLGKKDQLGDWGCTLCDNQTLLLALPICESI